MIFFFFCNLKLEYVWFKNRSRVAKFGELAPECASAYYKYGCALLYKAQEESDPLGSMPKKEGESSAKNAVDGESSAASATNNAGEGKHIDHRHSQ